MSNGNDREDADLKPSHPDDAKPGLNDIVVQTMHYGLKPMIFEKDVAVTVRDGTVIYVNVFRPPEEGNYPVVVSFDPYGKDTIHVAAVMPAGGPLLYAWLVRRVAVRRLGGAGSRFLGSQRLCRGQGRGQGNLGVQGPDINHVADGDRGFRRSRRVVRHAALEQRQCRHQRRFLFVHDPVAGRTAQSAALEGG